MDSIGNLSVFFLLLVLIGFAIFIAYIMAWHSIYTKAGHSGMLCLLHLVPGINILAFFLLAWGKWPYPREHQAPRYRRVRRDNDDFDIEFED